MTSSELHQRSTVRQITRAHPLALVGLGGASGSLARHGVVSTPLDPSVAVFILNVIGSLALGAPTAWLQHSNSPFHGTSGEARVHWLSLLGLGFCGGLTTFSTHMVDVAQRLDSSSTTSALISLLATAGVATAAAGAGYEAARRAIGPINTLRPRAER